MKWWAPLIVVGAMWTSPENSRAQQITRWGLGSTWANMVTSEPGGSTSGNTMRRFASLWVTLRLSERGPLSFDTGAKFVAKGFEVSGPTIHSEYLDIPLTVSIGRRGRGPFLTVGPYLGIRLHCSRSARTASGTVRDGCGRSGPPIDWTPIRRWELGGQIDIGRRLPTGGDGAFLIGAGLARSLIDLRAEDWGRTRNEVVSIWIAFDRS